MCALIYCFTPLQGKRRYTKYSLSSLTSLLPFLLLYHPLFSIKNSRKSDKKPEMICTNHADGVRLPIVIPFRKRNGPTSQTRVRLRLQIGILSISEFYYFLNYVLGFCFTYLNIIRSMFGGSFWLMFLYFHIYNFLIFVLINVLEFSDV